MGAAHWKRLPSPFLLGAALLLLLAAALYGPSILGRDLWPEDEPRFALIGKEMAETNDFLLPHLNREVYSDKPPLFFWLVALSMKLAGTTKGEAVDWAARLPSFLAAFGCLLLTVWLGRMLFDRQTGWLGAVVLATSFEFLHRAPWISTDMTLCFFILLAIALLAYGWRAGPKAARWAGRAAFAAMALATLTKGPVGLVIPLGAWMAFALIRRDRSVVRSLPWASGLFVFGAVLGLWLVPACVHGGWDYTFDLLFRQNVVRYLNAWNHEEPFYYYFYKLPLNLLPWTFFLPAAGALLLREARRGTGEALLSGWILFVFLLFTLSDGKRGVYVLPLYPAVALAVSAALRRAVHAPLGTLLRRLVYGGAILLAFTLVASASVGPLITSDRLPLLREAALAAAGVAVLAALGLLGALLAGRIVRGAGWIALAVAVLHLLFILRAAPLVDAHHNGRAFARRLVAEVGREAELGVAFRNLYKILFYADRYADLLRTRIELSRFLRSPRPAYCLIDEEAYDVFRSRIRAPHRIVFSEHYGKRKIYLLVNRTAPAVAGAGRAAPAVARAALILNRMAAEAGANGRAAGAGAGEKEVENGGAFR